VPTTSAGGSLQWSHRFGAHLAAAGGDARWVKGETDERVYNAGAFARTREAGGQQFIGGVFVQDVYTPHPSLELVGGIRGDYWYSYDGTRHDTPPAAGVPAEQTFNNVERIIPSGRVAALFHATPTTDLRASAYQGFRVPTLNEQYRVFRVRNDVTVANESLRPEQLTGGELGVQQRWGPFQGRVTGYWNDVHDLVANVTLSSPLSDCPVGTTCRQRQNLDLARIRGIETELELRPARDWRFLVSYLFADARVVNAPQLPGLEGKRLAQVPEHSATATVRFSRPSWFDASVTARYVGDQYEDDVNSLPLGGYIVVDVAVSRAITRNVEIYAAAENIFDRTYTTGRTTDGVISIGEPFIARGGLRLRF
jgi:outer membrane receptor protein involved in Fe transport